MSGNRTSHGIPLRGLLCFMAMAASQLLCYYLPRLFLPHMAPHIMTVPLDAHIPLSPPWVAVYCLSFPFWICSGLWIVSQEKRTAYRMTSAYVAAMLLSAAVFLIWPGTMERPAISGHDFFSEWLRLIYRLDAPTNLFPSLHVLITYFCWRGTMYCGGIPRWYRVFSFVFFLLVSCSVLLVKQHALIDVPAGILIGELSLQLARVLRLERIPFAVDHHFHKERTE